MRGVAVTWCHEPRGDVVERCQVVVVGSGAGGALAALTLAEAGLDVVVVEDGFRYNGEAHGMAESLASCYADAGFRTSTGTPTLPVAGGRAVGGSTVVNSALCFRTPTERLAEWNEQSGGALSDEAHYWRTQDAVERVLRVAETPDALLSGNDRAQRLAAERLGWRAGNIRRNTPACTGCGRCNFGCTVGGKYSVDVELLPRAARSGARVYAGCRVERVMTGRVEGVVRGRDGAPRGRIAVEADAVVLSAGAIETPRLLLRSELAASGGEVGRGLRLQPVISALGFVEEHAFFAPGATQGHYIDEFVDDDILFETNPILGSMLAALPYVGAEAHEMLRRAAHWVSTGMLVRDRTQGRVTATTIEYDLVAEDHQRLIRALRHGARLWREGLGASTVVLGCFGRSAVRTEAELEARLRDLPPSRLVLYSSHPQASCSLGRCTDETGQVLGAPGVWVVDASVLPSNVGRNPQISVMTVARILSERLAELLGGSLAPLVSA